MVALRSDLRGVVPNRDGFPVGHEPPPGLGDEHYRPARSSGRGGAGGLALAPAHGRGDAGGDELLRAGVPVKAVTERLGHADVAVTMRVYEHATAQDDQAAADALARALGS